MPFWEGSTAKAPGTFAIFNILFVFHNLFMVAHFSWINWKKGSEITGTKLTQRLLVGSTIYMLLISIMGPLITIFYPTYFMAHQFIGCYGAGLFGVSASPTVKYSYWMYSLLRLKILFGQKRNNKLLHQIGYPDWVFYSIAVFSTAVYIFFMVTLHKGIQWIFNPLTNRCGWTLDYAYYLKWTSPNVFLEQTINITLMIMFLLKMQTMMKIVSDHSGARTRESQEALRLREATKKYFALTMITIVGSWVQYLMVAVFWEWGIPDWQWHVWLVLDSWSVLLMDQRYDFIFNGICCCKFFREYVCKDGKIVNQREEAERDMTEMTKDSTYLDETQTETETQTQTETGTATNTQTETDTAITITEETDTQTQSAGASKFSVPTNSSMPDSLGKDDLI